MKEMESKDKTKCFICCNKILNPEDCNFQETVDVNVLIIFMLRNLLEIPTSLCENLLSRKGNPSDWIICCPFCVSLTRRAQRTFMERLELEQKFNQLKLQIRSTALLQWRLSNEIQNEKHKNNFADEIIRNIFLSYNEENSEITVKLDPDSFTALIKDDVQCFVDDTFEDAESSVNDAFLWDNISDNDETGDNSSQALDSPSPLSILGKRKVDNDSEKLEIEKFINPSFESITKNELSTDFDPEDPYVCAECGQRFPYIHLKELHQRKHQRNVKCDTELPKRKYQKTVKKRDKEVLKQNHQKNVNKCDMCNAFFKTRRSLSAHQGDCHTQELSDVNRNSNPHYEENMQHTQLKLGDFTNIGNTDLNSDSKPAETEVNDKDIVMKVEKEKTTRPKRAKRAYKKKRMDSDSDYSPEDDSDSEFEKEAFEPGSSDSEMSDSNIKPIKKEEHTKPKRKPSGPSKLISKTSELPFKCNDCEMSFEYSHLQKLHRLKEHNVEMQCEQCDSKFVTRKDWTIHCQKDHPTIRYPGVRFKPNEKTSMTCPVCRELLQPGSIKAHLQAHESISCYICNKSFEKLFRLVRHQRKFHYKECNLIPIQCSHCEKLFASRAQLGKHIISWHTKEYPDSCPICNVGLFSKDLKKHIDRVHTEAKPFVCSFCGKGYTVKSELENHEIVKHTKDFKFTCDVCGKQFARNYQLEKHIVLHQENPPNPKPFVCELCGDSFSLNCNFQHHRRGQHYKELNLEPYQCLECGIIYTTPSGLNHHNNTIHKQELKHECTDCGEKFLDSSRLQNHILRNHGEKKFSCESCDKSYFTKLSLEKHVQRYHTKDFSFKCTMCPLGYSDNWSLNRHLKLIHGKDKETV